MVEPLAATAGHGIDGLLGDRSKKLSRTPLPARTRSLSALTAASSLD
jgi:hypothetical protein